jgi:hypothetical protein
MSSQYASASLGNMHEHCMFSIPKNTQSVQLQSTCGTRVLYCMHLIVVDGDENMCVCGPGRHPQHY